VLASTKGELKVSLCKGRLRGIFNPVQYDLEKNNKEKQEELEKSGRRRETALREKEEEGARLRKEVDEFPARLKMEVNATVSNAVKSAERSLSKKEFC
jgi:hypothetical protein